MRLRVSVTSTKVDDRYINFLIKLIKVYIKDKLDIKRLSVFDSYLVNELGLNTTAFNVIAQALDNLEYFRFNKNYIISINSKVNLINNDAKLYDICKLINYGNLYIKGYPIFTEAFEFFESNANIYLQLYR